MIKRYLLLLVYILVSVSITKAQLNLTELDKYIEKSYKDWEMPGMSIAIVKNDSVIFIKGYGVNELGKPQKVDENTIFGIASNTKAFTATALGTLVDKGIINWNDKVIKHIPYFEMYSDYVTQSFTITDLLSHHSGLKTFSGDLLWNATTYNRKEIIERIKYLKPTYEFRTDFGYSNLLFLVAGEIIPKVTGISFDDYLKTNLFEPLGMINTNTSVENHKTTDNLAKPHTYKNGKLVSIPYISWDNIAPAGAINSSALDMSKWIKLQLNKGSLNGVNYYSKKISNNLWSANTINKITPTDNYLYPSMHFHAYGLGWDLFDYHGKKIVNHSGGLDGMISKVALVPEENFGFVILTNSMNYFSDALTYRILDMLLDEPKTDYSELFVRFFKQGNQIALETEKQIEEARNSNLKPTVDKSKLAGTYGGKLYGSAKITLKGERLMLQMLPTPQYHSELNHWQADTFTVKFDEFPSLPTGKVYFTYDKDGNPEEFFIDIPNPDFHFTELEFKRE